jgi:predicted kinase
MKLENVAKKAPEIIVLCGLPASGKSFWRDKMLAKTNKEYIIVSSDDEIERMAAADGTNYTDGFDMYIGKATAIMKEKFKNAVENRKNIIWDQTNMTPKKRMSILAQVPKDYHKVAVVFEITDAELKARSEKRQKETGKSVPLDVVRSMANSYSPPTKGEGFDVITFV